MRRELDALRDAWEGLARKSGNVFATWEWASTWAHHFANDRELVPTPVNRGGGPPVAILPLYVWRQRPLRVLRFLGHRHADELGPVCAPGDRQWAADELARVSRHADLLLAEQLRGDEWRDWLEGAVVRHEASPSLHLAGRTWEEILTSWSVNRRQEARRHERRLTRAHDVRFRLGNDPDRLDADLDVMFALHGARWGSRSVFADHAFHRDFARVALERGWLRLWFLEVDGRPVATWYGFRFAGVESYYQAGRDPGWSRWAVGRVLLLHTIREAAHDGIAEYRFLRGDETFKYRFADENSTLETLLTASTARGRAVAALLRGAQAFPALRPVMRRLGS